MQPHEAATAGEEERQNHSSSSSSSSESSSSSDDSNAAPAPAVAASSSQPPRSRVRALTERTTSPPANRRRTSMFDLSTIWVSDHALIKREDRGATGIQLDFHFSFEMFEKFNRMKSLCLLLYFECLEHRPRKKRQCHRTMWNANSIVMDVESASKASK